MELLGGTVSDDEFKRLRSRLRGLHYLSIIQQDWSDAGQLMFDLRRIGVTVPFTDVLLAIVAHRHNVILLHADRDFDAIGRLSKASIESMVDQISST
jgi:predicted nucleic acid-binding protein